MASRHSTPRLADRALSRASFAPTDNQGTGELLWKPSLLAMASCRSTSRLADRALSRASFAPTDKQGTGELLWELSLLAMASCHSTSRLADRALSRASFAPTDMNCPPKVRMCVQLLGGSSDNQGTGELLWEPSLLAMASCRSTSRLADRALSRASFAPTDNQGTGDLLWKLSLLAMASCHST